MRDGFRHENSAVARGARDDPRRAPIVEFPTFRDRLVGGKNENLGRGAGVGYDDRHPPLLGGCPIRTVTRRAAYSFENPWPQVSVLIYIDDGGGQKVR